MAAFTLGCGDRALVPRDAEAGRAPGPFSAATQSQQHVCRFPAVVPRGVRPWVSICLFNPPHSLGHVVLDLIDVESGQTLYTGCVWGGLAARRSGSPPSGFALSLQQVGQVIRVRPRVTIQDRPFSRNARTQFLPDESIRVGVVDIAERLPGPERNSDGRIAAWIASRCIVDIDVDLQQEQVEAIAIRTVGTFGLDERASVRLAGRIQVSCAGKQVASLEVRPSACPDASEWDRLADGLWQTANVDTVRLAAIAAHAMQPKAWAAEFVSSDEMVWSVDGPGPVWIGRFGIQCNVNVHRRDGGGNTKIAQTTASLSQEANDPSDVPR